MHALLIYGRLDAAAAEWISWGFTKGAEKTGEFVKYGSEKWRQHMEPEQEPSKINPKVQKGAQCVRSATGSAVKISEYLGKCVNNIYSTSSPFRAAAMDMKYWPIDFNSLGM